MKEPTYPGALSVAASVVAHMARQTSAAAEQGYENLARQPGTRAVEALVDAAFWASFRREEGQPPRISLAFVPPEDTESPLRLAHPISLAAGELARLAPTVERRGIHLGVWGDVEEMYVWGTTRHIPVLCVVVEVLQPGQLVIKHRRLPEFGKFANVAVLEGDHVKVVDERSVRTAECPALLSTLLGFGFEARRDGVTDALVQLSISMRTHGHGGTLLVVPAGSETWRDSIVWPVRYMVDPPHTALADLLRHEPDEKNGTGWQDRLTSEAVALAGLTAVDGATVVTDTFELQAFGVKITRSSGSAPITRLTLSEPILGVQSSVVHPNQIGGTRHLSAAQFIHDQRDALALVASQDGRFTVFAWSRPDDTVQAYRMEALLI